MVLFPTWSIPPASYHDLISLYEAQLQQAVANGHYVPYVWPYRSLAGILVILYFLIPPTSSRIVYYARYPLFAFNVFWAVKTIGECRSAAVSTGYGLGLINAWAIIWLASLLIFNDARNDFKRIEFRKIFQASERRAGITEITEVIDPTPLVNGAPRRQELEPRHSNGTASKRPSATSGMNEPPDGKYAYQPLPPTFPERFTWAFDLLSNFRGVAFNFLIPGTPPPPKYVLSSLPHPPTSTRTPPYHETRRGLMRRTFVHIAVGYLTLDVLKSLMMADPYFWGDITATPPPYLPDAITTSQAGTKLYRILLSFAATYTSLSTIFALSPLQILVLPKWFLGARAEAWQYPPMYGTPRALWERGLIGFWGQYWHQTFRFGFQAPTTWLCRKCGIREKSQVGKVLGLVIAFGCSGCLHAAGSYTMWPATNPLEPATFFWLQPLGILVQQVLTFGLSGSGIADRMPAYIGGVTRIVGLGLWFWWTANFFADDVARGGIWLFEPVPLSLVRGIKGEGWLCWGPGLFGWYSGDRWWKSGITF